MKNQITKMIFILSIRCLIIISILFYSLLVCGLPSFSTKAAYYSELPDCLSSTYNVVKKKSSWRGVVCPMVKDEEGFLSEWIAFYEMQGFDHVILYDNNSTSSFAEIQPWIDRGFAEIVTNWWPESVDNKHMKKKKRNFFDMMYVKYLSEVNCKERAVAMGYDIFVSLDLDEYLFPTNPNMTAMDELATWFNETQRRVMPIPKLNFNPAPHFLEPINLLMIEAYFLRMNEANKMNFYKSISSKVALWLTGHDSTTFSNQTAQFLIHCCDFHGCGNYRNHQPCANALKEERWNIEGKHFKWRDGLHIHHYARSLEKYMLKQKTWETASGADAKGYDFYHFLDRTLGFTYDDTAIPWTCQLRDLLRERTKESDYLRPGDFWYRNPEFGRVVSDVNKRGRGGSGFGKYLGDGEMNPYPPGLTYQRAHKPYQQPLPAVVNTDNNTASTILNNTTTVTSTKS